MRASVRIALPMLLVSCGCRGSVRRESETGALLLVKFPLASAISVYGALLQYGIAFDVPSHLEWSRLCTIQAFAAGLPISDGLITLHLEIIFRRRLERSEGIGLVGRA